MRLSAASQVLHLVRVVGGMAARVRRSYRDHLSTRTTESVLFSVSLSGADNGRLFLFHTFRAALASLRTRGTSSRVLRRSLVTRRRSSSFPATSSSARRDRRGRPRAPRRCRRRGRPRGATPRSRRESVSVATPMCSPLQLSDSTLVRRPKSRAYTGDPVMADEPCVHSMELFGEPNIVTDVNRGTSMIPGMAHRPGYTNKAVRSVDSISVGQSRTGIDVRPDTVSRPAQHIVDEGISE